MLFPWRVLFVPTNRIQLHGTPWQRTSSGIFLLRVAGLALLAGLLLPKPQFAAANLPGDGGFDQSTNPGNFPNSGFWNPDHIGEAGAVVDGVGPRSSPHSLHVYTGAAGSDYLSRPRHDDLPSGGGLVYHAGGYLQTRAGLSWQSGSAAYFRVAFLNSASGELAHYDTTQYTAASSSWQLYEVTTPGAPAGTAFVRFTFYLQKPSGASGQSIVNVDDCFLEEVQAPPALGAEPQLLAFGATNDRLTLVIANQGGGVLEWSVTPSGEAWLSVVPPAAGSTTPDQPDQVEILVDRSGLAVGEYFASATVTPVGGQAEVLPVEMVVPAAVPDQPAIVTVAGHRLMVQRRRPDGALEAPQPYRIQGLAWSPASVETTAAYSSRRQAFLDWHATDLGLLRGAAANTVYVFLDFGLDPADYQPVLDSAYANDIMVVMTVDEDGNANQSRAQAIVAAYKAHPAILMWAIGNEWNINLYHSHYTTVLEAAQATESLAQLIQSWDATHPVASIYGDINISGQSPATAEIVNTLCPSVDVWGLNIYRGQGFFSLFEEWAALTAKPMFLSEFGIDSFHTTQYYPNPIAGYRDEAEQAAWIHDLWVDLEAELSAVNSTRVCLGGTAFSFVDEWWKVAPDAQHDTGGFFTTWNPSAFPDSFANEEYFGSVKIDGNVRVPKAAYYQIRADFQASSEKLMCDGFESGNTDAWSATVGGP